MQLLKMHFTLWIKTAISTIWFISLISASRSTTVSLMLNEFLIRGVSMEAQNGRQFYAFRGITYAHPPVESQRFEQAQQFTQHSRNTQFDASRCMQRNIDAHNDEIIGIEECLHLNVYTPHLVNSTSKEPLSKYPVMVWIHGGGWQSGSGHSAYYGPHFLLNHELILVTFNYRLGPLGFLSTADDYLPGNYGLKDQLRVLEWVQQNIAAFGGDEDCVTVFGHEAGAASAQYLMSIPRAKGLFHRVIAQSGTIYNPWAFNTAAMARNVASKLGEHLGCPLIHSIDYSSCIRGRKAEDILEAAKKLQVHAMEPFMPFRPVAETNYNENFFLEAPGPKRLLIDVPFMTGFAAHEGALAVAALYGHKSEKYLEEFKKNFSNLAPITLGFDANCAEHLHREVTFLIREQYLKKEDISEHNRFDVIKMYTDALFRYGMEVSIRYMSRQTNPVYYYNFAYEGSRSHSKLYDNSQRTYGVAHGDELQYLFPMENLYPPGTERTEEDFKMINIMTSMWYNFAKHGKPTAGPVRDPLFSWVPIKRRGTDYLLIKSPSNISMQSTDWSEGFIFWTHLPCSAGLVPMENPRRRREEL